MQPFWKELHQFLLNQYPDFDTVVENVLTALNIIVAPHYDGPVGIDMMLCPGSLCPCIETNWRMTMGHVAQALTEQGHTGKLLVHYIYGQYCAEVEAFQ